MLSLMSASWAMSRTSPRNRLSPSRKTSTMVRRVTTLPCMGLVLGRVISNVPGSFIASLSFMSHAAQSSSDG